MRLIISALVTLFLALDPCHGHSEFIVVSPAMSRHHAERACLAHGWSLAAVSSSNLRRVAKALKESNTESGWIESFDNRRPEGGHALVVKSGGDWCDLDTVATVPQCRAATACGHAHAAVCKVLAKTAHDHKEPSRNEKRADKKRKMIMINRNRNSSSFDPSKERHDKKRSKREKKRVVKKSHQQHKKKPAKEPPTFILYSSQSASPSYVNEILPRKVKKIIKEVTTPNVVEGKHSRRKQSAQKKGSKPKKELDLAAISKLVHQTSSSSSSRPSSSSSSSSKEPRVIYVRKHRGKGKKQLSCSKKANKKNTDKADSSTSEEKKAAKVKKSKKAKKNSKKRNTLLKKPLRHRSRSHESSKESDTLSYSSFAEQVYASSSDGPAAIFRNRRLYRHLHRKSSSSSSSSNSNNTPPGSEPLIADPKFWGHETLETTAPLINATNSGLSSRLLNSANNKLAIAAKHAEMEAIRAARKAKTEARRQDRFNRINEQKSAKIDKLKQKLAKLQKSANTTVPEAADKTNKSASPTPKVVKEISDGENTSAIIANPT